MTTNKPDEPSTRADVTAIRIESLLAKYTGFISVVSVVVILVAATLTVVDVALRWLVHGGINGLNEYNSLCYAVAIVACLPAGAATKVNLKIDLVEHWISPSLRAWLEVAGAIALLAVFGLLGSEMWAMAARFAANGRVTMFAELPLAPFYYAISVLLWATFTVQSVIAVNAFRRGLTKSRAASPAQKLAVGAFFAVVVVVIGLPWATADAVSAWAASAPGKMIFVAFGLLWVGMLMAIPLAAVTALVGLVAAVFFVGAPAALSTFSESAVRLLTNPSIGTLPLFLLMGSFAGVSGMAEDVYKLTNLIFSRFRGGLGYATIGSCAGFGALTGSSIATAATVGRIAIPEMRARGYSPALATGICAGGGTLGPIVPPGSGPLILFALLTEASVGQLLIASIVPAILTVTLYLITIWIYIRVSPKSAPPTIAAVDWTDVGPTFRRCIPPLLLVGVVMGGIYFGILTDVESAAVGALGAGLITIYRRTLNRKTFLEAMTETTSTTAMVYALIIGSGIFSFAIGASGLGEQFTALVKGVQLSPEILMLLILVGYLALGMVMEAYAVMIITVPFMTPVVQAMGYDILWWGIVMLCIVETGMIVPPFGLNVIVLKGMLKDVSIWTIYKGVAPFAVADVAKLALLTLFPLLVLWLPRSMSQ